MTGTTPTNLPTRLLCLITTPKLAPKASEVLAENNLPYLFRLSALGTAPSEILDVLGLGDISKTMTLSLIPKLQTASVCKQMKKALKLGIGGNGIGFTLPINGMNRLLLQALSSCASETETQEQGKEENAMTDYKFVLIAAIVNPGFSEDVMKAARSAGARGGTVVHTHQISDATATSLGISEEKEIVLIVSAQGSKVEIMKAISASCGVKTEAQGNVISLPIDSLIGMDMDEE